MLYNQNDLQDWHKWVGIDFEHWWQ